MNLFSKSFWILGLGFLGLNQSANADAGRTDPTYHTERIPISSASDRKVEFFWTSPAGKGPWPAIVYIHGHQEGERPGGLPYASRGILERVSKGGVVAVAISQPGYGKSDGPADFCGPISQAAVHAVIERLRRMPIVRPEKIALNGGSRGAILAALVAAQDARLAAVALVSGFYDFKAMLPRLRETAKSNPEVSELVHNLLTEGGGETAALEQRSALPLAAQIRVPTLILNGERDNRTDPSQARALGEKIAAHGTFSQVIVYPNYDHRIPFPVEHAAVDPFFAKYLSLAPLPTVKPHAL